jgi:hypothetical protein
MDARSETLVLERHCSRTLAAMPIYPHETLTQSQTEGLPKTSIFLLAIRRGVH